MTSMDVLSGVFYFPLGYIYVFPDIFCALKKILIIPYIYLALYTTETLSRCLISAVGSASVSYTIRTLKQKEI